MGFQSGMVRPVLHREQGKRLRTSRKRTRTCLEVITATAKAEQQEQAAFAALLESLDSDQLAAAQLSQSYGDILLGL